MLRFRTANDIRFTIEIKGSNIQEAQDVKVFIQHTQNGKRTEVTGTVTESGIRVTIQANQIERLGQYYAFVSFKEADSAFESGFREVNIGSVSFEMVSLCEPTDPCQSGNVVMQSNINVSFENLDFGINEEGRLILNI